MKKNTFNRRDFLGYSTCSAMSSAGLLSTLTSLLTTNQLKGQTSNGGDRKALVCLFLLGGNDSYNMLLPGTGTELSKYRELRGDYALTADESVSISDGEGVNPPSFQLTKKMPLTKHIYDEGNLAFVANTGTLIDKINNVDELESKKISPSLGNHVLQQDLWQLGVPLPDSEQGRSGWFARMAERLAANAGGTASGVTGFSHISFGGMNILQSESGTIPYVTTSGGPKALLDRPIRSLWQQLLSSGADDLTRSYHNLLDQAYFSRVKESSNDLASFQSAWSAEGNLEDMETGSVFENSENSVPLNVAYQKAGSLGKQLRGVLRLLLERKNNSSSIFPEQQTFFVTMGGFDTHASNKENHGKLLSTLDNALAYFYTLINKLGLSDEVVLFTASDFGRKLIPNGVGTDHAWGGHQIVMGGPVAGKRVYGDYPLLVEGNLLTQNTRVIPTTSTQQYFAPLAKWYGRFDQSQLSDLFPVVGGGDTFELDALNGMLGL